MPKTTKAKKSKEIKSIKIEAFGREEETRTISVNDLPDCNHKAKLSKWISSMKDTKICVLAVYFENRKQWRAYAGYPDVRDLRADYKEMDGWHDMEWACENIRDMEEVKIIGTFIPKETATLLFPDWTVLTYFE